MTSIKGEFGNDGVNSPSTPNSAGSGSTGSSGHKNSLKGTKLARRARSFKDDLFEKISQMRTPTNTLGRSHSPHSPRSKHAKPHNEEVKPPPGLDYHVRQIKNALKHFKDVISKNKLEVLPGNGTVVLELIANMYAALQMYTLNENSSTLISATTQVYLSLGKLLKLCDEVLLCEDEKKCASLNDENVKEIVDLVESAVQNLVNLANEKIKEKENAVPFSSSTSNSSSNTLHRPSIDVAGQRTSLPDIPLTPKERDILEKSSSNPMRASHSTESILRDSSPPPKPPLPNRSNNPPPLPPKRRSQPKQNSTANESVDFTIDSSLLSSGLDHVSMRSRSPDDNSSLLSASAGSLDSAFNHSREEEELKALAMDTSFEDQFLEDDVERMFAQSFASMQSIRASMQSVSTKRSSEHSMQSHKSSIASSTELSSIRKLENSAFNDKNINLTAATATTDQSLLSSSSFSSSSATIASSSAASSTSTATNQNKSMSCFASNQTFASNMEQCVTSSCNIFKLTSLCNKINNSYNKFTISADTHADINKTQTSEKTLNTMKTMSSIMKTNSLEVSSLDDVFASDDILTADPLNPPALPVKTRTKSTTRERHVSTYDNVEETDHHGLNSLSKDELPELRHTAHQHHAIFHLQSKHQSLIDPRHRYNTTTAFSDGSSCGEQPPPLPIKKKHIIAYMEICSASTRGSSEHLRHSVHTTHTTEHFSPNRNISHSHTMNLSPIRKQLSSQSSPTTTPSHEKPPALPPKSNKQSQHQQRVNCKTPTIITTPPSSPKPSNLQVNSNSSGTTTTTGMGGLSSSEVGKSSGRLSGMSCEMTTVNEEELSSLENDNDSDSGQMQQQQQSPLPHHYQNNLDVHHRYQNQNQNHHQHHNQANLNIDDANKTETNSDQYNNSSNININNNSNNSSSFGGLRTSADTITTDHVLYSNNDDDEGIDVVLRHNSPNKKNESPVQSIKLENMPNLIEEIDISDYLIFKKEGEDGPDVKGGYLDALIVHASKVQKNGENAFSEAFITTFRTFISPLELIEKLTHRYTIFCCQVSDQKQKAAKETFSLLVRVVNDLTASDLTPHLLSLLVEFVYQLVCSGQLSMAKLLRNKLVEKVIVYKEHKYYANNSLEQQRNIVTNQPSLLDLKSVEIAEQMTLLDAELFQKIEIPEVLLFAKEQCEERSPNLNKFTEHFNKMSYWARSQILKQDDAKDREKHVIKFIKIMKHLRKMNNYNSYLALLSALDSAPIRRLEWHKTITEGLKEYCALIDSSSSFRVYRQALAETNPPCIPYIGLVLQDLTFVHVGNQDYLRDCIVNFSKRWQQHNIIVNMKRFKKCAYPFKKNDKIIRFFENFENFLGEEQMWQISENIKPRGRKPVQH